MRCPSCGHKNPAGLLTCNFCSAPLPTKKQKQHAAKRKKRLRLAVLGVIGVLLLLCLVFFSKIESGIAVWCIHAEHYDMPARLWQSHHDDTLRDLGAYAALRRDIKNRYPDLSLQYDASCLAAWCQTAESLQQNAHISDSAICEELDKLTADLQYIQKTDSDYTALRSTALDLMDVFCEYNRLHLNDENGNIGFTAQAELNQLALWQVDLDRLNQFAVTVKGYENVYLFSYMLKEAQGEITQLTTEMNAVTEKGYSPTDTVRYSDNKARTFPSVLNREGIQLNVAQKENYEAHMRADLLCYLINATLIAYYF